MNGCSQIDINSPTTAEFDILYPNFAGDARTPIFLQMGISELPFSCLCKVWKKAVYLYIAHSLTTSIEAGIGAGTEYDQQIQRHHVDDVDTAFFKNESQVDKGASGFGATPFGRELLELIKRRTNTGVLNTGMLRKGGC